MKLIFKPDPLTFEGEKKNKVMYECKNRCKICGIRIPKQMATCKPCKLRFRRVISKVRI